MKFKLKNGDIAYLGPRTKREMIEDSRIFLVCLLNYHVRATKLGHVGLSAPDDANEWFKAAMTSKEMAQDRYATALLLAINLYDQFLEDNPEEEIRDLESVPRDELLQILNSESNEDHHFHFDKPDEFPLCQK